MDKKLIINFYLTYKCNLSCDYCQVYNNDYKLDRNYELFFLPHFKDFISLFDFSGTDIEFFGGEPLLEKDFIMKFYEFYKNTFSYKITTNGIFLDNKLNFLNSIFVSVHHSSIEKLKENILKGFFSTFKNISFTLVVDKFNFDKFYDFSLFLKQNGFSKLNILPVFSKYNWEKKDILNLNKFVLYLKELGFDLNYLGYENNKADLEFSIDISGDIYSFTGEYIFHPKLKNAFYVGNLFRDSHFEMKNKIIDKFENLNKLSYEENARIRKAFGGDQELENFIFINKLLKYYKNNN